MTPPIEGKKSYQQNTCVERWHELPTCMMNTGEEPTLLIRQVKLVAFTMVSK